MLLMGTRKQLIYDINCYQLPEDNMYKIHVAVGDVALEHSMIECSVPRN